MFERISVLITFKQTGEVEDVFMYAADEQAEKVLQKGLLSLLQSQQIEGLNRLINGA